MRSKSIRSIEASFEISAHHRNARDRCPPCCSLLGEGVRVSEGHGYSCRKLRCWVSEGKGLIFAGS